MQRCHRDRIPAPVADVATWRADGWTPMEPLHIALVSYESARSELGDGPLEGPAGPVLDWPPDWDGWSLVEHRRVVARHFREMQAIEDEERAAARRGGR